MRRLHESSGPGRTGFRQKPANRRCVLIADSARRNRSGLTEKSRGSQKLPRWERAVAWEHSIATGARILLSSSLCADATVSKWSGIRKQSTCVRSRPLAALPAPRRVRGARRLPIFVDIARSEEHTSELQSLRHLVCRLLLE